MRTLVSILAILAGCGTQTVHGTLVDGLTGDPIPRVRVVLRATSTVPFDCQVFEGTTAEDGSVTIEGPCLSKTGYRITLSDESLWLPDAPTIDPGGDGTVTLQALRAPAGSGAYLLRDGALTSLRTHADLQTETIWGSEEPVLFPRSLPAEGEIPRVGPGTFLVLTGKDNLAEARLTPLIRSEEPRRFGNPEQWTEMQPWWYLGISFTDDTTFTRQAVMVDESKTVTREQGDRAARILAHDALPPGRYALQTAGSRRITVLDFTAADPAP